MTRAWGEGTTVLVAEDDLLTARMMRARIEMEGLRVLEARNGDEAMGLLAGEEVHMVVTDLMMPGMDGFRLIQELRELPDPVGHLPVMVVSTKQGEQDMVRCLSIGADDYVTKPFSPQVFIQRLWRMYLRHHGQAR